MQSYSPTNPLKLGTRGSPLAMWQALRVRELLCAAHAWPLDHVEILSMKTTGDQFTDRPLSAIGGKGLFTKELEQGLVSGEIDIAVHSMKDVATILPDGLVLAAVLEREDVRDAFVSYQYAGIDDLPTRAIVGTSSLRRKAQLLRIRPDLQVIEFRGLVDTRLTKLRDGVADATFLASAGLIRLGRSELFETGIAKSIAIENMLPAAAQGAIGVEIRESDEKLAELLSPINHHPTQNAITIERAFLRVLDGSCRTPIAALALQDGEKFKLKGEVLSLDGRKRLQGEWTSNHIIELGVMGAQDLLAHGAADVLA